MKNGVLEQGGNKGVVCFYFLADPGPEQLPAGYGRPREIQGKDVFNFA